MIHPRQKIWGAAIAVLVGLTLFALPAIAETTGGTITTGNAVASSTVDNGLNSNTTDPDQPGRTNSSTITSSNTNDGALDSAATSTADTGSNTVTGGRTN